jgi:predicted transglutaminase-like cysteine proteinase
MLSNTDGIGASGMFKTVTGLLLVAALCMTGPSAFAIEKDSTNYKKAGDAFEQTYGPTLPPIGYVNYCERYQRDCQPLGGTRYKLELTPERWKLLGEVNTFVNTSITPESDQDLYGVPERWEIPTTAGDCEDYVLLKQRYLEGLGFPVETLLITVVLDESGEGHAILTVRTDRGDLVLDNRRNAILLWSETRYEFLKRQSQENPQLWVALTRKSRRGELNIAGGK